MIWIALFVTAALTVILLITLSNLLFFPRLKTGETPATGEAPFVSVMIPARDEAPVIAQTVRALLAQDYPVFELIVLDDGSTDGTGDILAGIDDERLTVIGGAPLPDDWMGKNWACHQMAGRARGDILIFTDADVRWTHRGALRAAVAYMERTKADLFSVWPTQHTVTWAERLTVPLMALVVIGYLPVIGAHYVPSGIFGAANGQCMAWRRTAYDKMGGHASVRDNVLEDVTLARRLKGAGLRLRMADGNRAITCRMYHDWPSVRDGYAKNILAGYGGSVAALLLATVFHWLLFVWPWAWLAWSPLAAVGLIALGYLIRALTTAFTHQRVLDVLLMPVSVLLMTRIAAQAIDWHYRLGGVRWKGRTVRRKPTT